MIQPIITIFSRSLLRPNLLNEISIVFVVVMQKNNYDQLMQHKPRLGRALKNLHIFIAIMFIGFAVIGFDIQFAILLVLLFLFVTTLLDYVGERLMQEINGNPIHPKKIL